MLAPDSPKVPAVFRPDEDGQFPVLLQRTPYGKQSQGGIGLMLDTLTAVARGYIVVHQDAGRFASDGDWILWSTSIVLKAGHRIRVQVTSSNFPRWDRNTNTGQRPEEATTLRVAHQTIFHDAARPSRIILPVVPAT